MPSHFPSCNDKLASLPVEPVDEHIAVRFQAYAAETPDPLVAALLVLAETILHADKNRDAASQLRLVLTGLGIDNPETWGNSQK